jgi:hypothetical protein
MRMDTTWEIAQAAAQHIVDDGMPWGLAKRQAAESMGLRKRIDLPDNELVLSAVREHIALFAADTQPLQQQQLAELALTWMDRLHAYRPHVTGAIWLGIATQWSDVHLDLYCDDPKMPEIELLNRGVAFDTAQVDSPRGESFPQIVISEHIPGWPHRVAVALTLRHTDDLRGAIKASRTGQAPRGDANALKKRMKGVDDG